MKTVFKILCFIGVLIVIVVFMDLERTSLTYFERRLSTNKSFHQIQRTDTGQQNNTDDDFDDIVARQLAERVRISCVVLSAPKYMESRVKYILRTWTKRCTKLTIISSKPNAIKNVVALDVQEGRSHLAEKALGAYRYVYEHDMNDADWFLMTDDDSYMIMENLRYFLLDEDTNMPVFFGEHYYNNFDFMGGGAGIVLSKEALRLFGKYANNSDVCQQMMGDGDIAIGKCLSSLGVKPKNSTDSLGKSRFHVFTPETYLGPLPDWFYEYKKRVIKVKMGLDAISDYVISFHYVPGDQMDALEYFIYHTKLYGIVKSFKHVNQH